MDRLVKYGVPATVLHRQVDERDQIGRARQAAETVSLSTHLEVQVERCQYRVEEHGCLPAKRATETLLWLPKKMSLPSAVTPAMCAWAM